jgi:hypothetical protein
MDVKPTPKGTQHTARVLRRGSVLTREYDSMNRSSTVQRNVSQPRLINNDRPKRRDAANFLTVFGIFSLTLSYLIESAKQIGFFLGS